jgi:glutathione S-transferase
MSSITPDVAEPLIVWGMKPLWGIASASPFGLKLKTWLRMTEIPYEPRVLTTLPKSKTGKIPYTEFSDGSLVADSGVLIERLTQARGVALDNHLDHAQTLQAHSLRRMLEEHFYYCLVHERWVDADNWQTTKRDYFADLPWLLRLFVPALARRKVTGYVRGMGIGRMPIEQIRARGEADLTVLSGILASQDFFFGQPSSTDAIVYGCVANLLAFPNTTHFARAIASHPNLVAHTARMKARYWT